MSLLLPDEDATLALGAALAPCMVPGLTFYLRGDLGAGKTTVVRGALRALGYDGPVRSPTYTLVELYNLSRLDLHHFDFYRFRDPLEWVDAGFRESFNGVNVTLVEWPEKAGPGLPAPDVEIRMEIRPKGRAAILESFSPAGQKCLAGLEAQGVFSTAS